jgi:DUF4097 and DUF4098 domain-containing protein YvlB
MFATAGLALAAYALLSVRAQVDRLRFGTHIERLVVHTQVGQVRVRGSARPDVVLTRRRHGVFGRAHVGAHARNGVLTLSSSCPRLDLACAVRQEVQVPAGVAVDIQVGSGPVDVRGLHAPARVRTRSGGANILNVTGPVEVSTGNGGVKLQRVTGATRVRTRVGPVTLKQVTGAVSVRTGQGDVFLDDVHGQLDAATGGEGDVLGTRLAVDALATSTQAGVVDVAFATAVDRLDVRTIAGGVRVEVPVAAYDVHATTGSGRVSVTGLPRDVTAPRVIDVRAGAGDVQIASKTDSGRARPRRSPRTGAPPAPLG